MELPEQDWQEGMCAKLEKSMYGTRGAAQNWSIKYETVLVNEMGFVQGKASPCNFYHPERDVRNVVHGDDFTTLATRNHCDWLAEELRKHIDLKVPGVLGSGPKDDKSTRRLNRIVSWDEQGITYECDQRHAEIIVKQL